MIRGIYTSASSMLVETIRQDMIANNLANVDTVGYKRDQGVFKELPSMVITRVNDGELYPPRPFANSPKIGKLGTGVILDESYTDFSIGKFQYTANDLDCALENPKAFFLTETANGMRYSRDGVFTINQDGYLTNMNGDYVMAEPEPPRNPEERVLVGEDGTPNPELEIGRVQVGQTDRLILDSEGRVLVNGQPRYRIVQGLASDRKAFRKENTNNFIRAYGDVQRADGKVKTGYVEKPNFSLVEEMVKMIEVSRAYEANSKCIQAHDSLLDKVVNSVGPTRR